MHRPISLASSISGISDQQSGRRVCAGAAAANRVVAAAVSYDRPTAALGQIGLVQQLTAAAGDERQEAAKGRQVAS
jgi:predicted transcriptional regulator